MASKKVRDERKITIKAVFGELPDVEKLIKAKDKTIDLITLVGIVRHAKPGMNKMSNGDVSEFVRFYGAFRATNCETGEVVEAGQAILPGAIQDKLYGAIPKEGDVEIKFGIKLSMKYQANALRNYVYVSESLLPPSENDPLTAIEQMAGLRALPKPAAEK